LGKGTWEKAPARRDAVGEVQGKRTESTVHKTSGGLESGLVGYLHARFGEPGLIMHWQRIFRGNTDFGGAGGLDRVADVHAIAGAVEVTALAGGRYGGVAEFGSDGVVDEQGKFVRLGGLVRIEAGEDVEFAHGMDSSWRHAWRLGT